MNHTHHRKQLLLHRLVPHEVILGHELEDRADFLALNHEVGYQPEIKFLEHCVELIMSEGQLVKDKLCLIGKALSGFLQRLIVELRNQVVKLFLLHLEVSWRSADFDIHVLLLYLFRLPSCLLLGGFTVVRLGVILF